MRDDIQRKLERRLFLDRLRRAAMPAALVAVLGAFLLLLARCSKVEKQSEVEGVVRFATVESDDVGRWSLALQVALPDGRLVQAIYFGRLPQPPSPGSTVRLIERRNFAGGRTYRWIGPATGP